MDSLKNHSGQVIGKNFREEARVEAGRPGSDCSSSGDRYQ